MSEMRAGLRFVMLAALSAMAVPLLEAQTAEITEIAEITEMAKVRQQIAQMVDSVSAANERVQEARRSATDQPDASFTEGGVRVQYPSASEQLSEAELKRVRRAIRDAFQHLERAYGAAGTALLAGDEWQIRTSVGRSLRQSARITLGDQGISVLTKFPFASRDVTDAALRRASNRAVALHPVIASFAGGAHVLSDAREQYYVAHRQLALGRSGPARRCAAGNLTACDGLLSNDPTRWHDGEPPQRGRLQPVTRGVHGSMVAFAIELKGAAVLDSLRAGGVSAIDAQTLGGAAIDAPAPSGAAATDPIALLAQIVGLPREEFLAQWYARMLAESRRHAAPSLPLSVTSLAWCGLILVIVARRRPR